MNKTFTFDTQNGPLTVSEGDVLESFRGERFVIRTPLHTDGLTYCTHETDGYQAGYYPSVFGLVIPTTDEQRSKDEWVKAGYPIADYRNRQNRLSREAAEDVRLDYSGSVLNRDTAKALFLDREAAQALIDGLVAWDAEQVRYDRHDDAADKLSRRLQVKLYNIVEQL
jgi:hypothetical protein